jgi:hypothetical protein
MSRVGKRKSVGKRVGTQSREKGRKKIREEGRGVI